jgi:hypothetical protein
MSDNKVEPMTVAALIAHLQQFPPEMQVIYQNRSDWSALTADAIHLTQAVPKRYWIMRAYENQIPTMSEENRKNVRTFVAFPGN